MSWLLYNCLIVAKTISIILPCFNEAGNIPLLVPEVIRKIPKSYNFEIICVDDGSLDNTTGAIKKLTAEDKKIKGIVFYRNFGHQQALRAGILASKGDALIIMDADFQHPPNLIPQMLQSWEKGYDLIIARKRQDKTASFWLRFRRNIGYYLWEKVSGGKIKSGTSNFMLFSKEIKDYVNSSGESAIFLRGLISIPATRMKLIDYKVSKRRFGKSSYSTKDFVNMFLNGFVSFSPNPLRAAFVVGVLIVLPAVFLLAIDIVSKIVRGQEIIEGFVTISLLMFLLNGIVLLYLGILGEYISIIFREVKKRPNYIIKERINL